MFEKVHDKYFIQLLRENHSSHWLYLHSCLRDYWAIPLVMFPSINVSAWYVSQKKNKKRYQLIGDIDYCDL